MAALDFPVSPTLNQVYTANGRSWKWDGTSWVAANFLSGSTSYDITLWQSGKPDASQVMLKVKLTRTVTFDTNFSGSTTVTADAGATSSSVFSIQKNGSQVGTVTYAPSATTGTFASSGAVVFSAGDVLSVIAPGTQDATLSGIGICLKGAQ